MLSHDACTFWPDATYASSASSAAKKRLLSSAQDFGLVSCQTSLPRAMESAQSIKSQRCERISPADLAPLPGENSLNPSGTSRRGLAARYASVASVWRNGRSMEPSGFNLGIVVLITALRLCGL